MITVLAFLLVFSVIVLVHEAGHYFSARLFKVQVNEFALGFSPRIWSKKRGNTIFTINAIPLGGYVRLLGEDGKKDDNPANFNNKKPWQKFIIFGSGVFMNFVFAWILLLFFYLFGGTAIIDKMWDHPGVNNTQRVVVSSVEAESPAVGQIIPGEKILRVNNSEVFTNSAVSRKIQDAGAGGLPVVLKIEGAEGIRDVEPKTYKDTITVNGNEKEIQRVGVALETVGEVRADWYMAPIVATKELFRLTKMTFLGAYDFFKTLVTSFRVSEDVGGPVAIAQITGAASETGFGALVQVVILLSIALGVFNILPFPALDGGHILFLAIEKVIRREIPLEVKGYINFAGFALLLLLIIVVTFRDVGRLGL